MTYSQMELELDVQAEAEVEELTTIQLTDDTPIELGDVTFILETEAEAQAS